MLIQDYPIIIPALTWVIVHILKAGIRLGQGESWNTSLFRSGGMPSAHSAFISSITAYLAVYYGMFHPITIAFFCIAIIVIYDAMHVRFQVGEHAKLLNTLFPEANLPTSIGHTPQEVGAGVFIGVLIGFLSPFITL